MFSFLSTNAARPFPHDIEELHQNACRAREMFYRDPTTGYNCFTSFAHLQRGFCCGNCCRHCPYGHFNVAPNLRKNFIQQTVLIPWGKEISNIYEGRNISAVFWSGDIASFLGLVLEKEGGVEQVLVTIFYVDSGVVFGNVCKINEIMDQARKLEKDLLVIPIKYSPEESLGEQKQEKIPFHTVLEALQTFRDKIRTLVFCDFHMADFQKRNLEGIEKIFTCQFPLLKVPPERLVSVLSAHPHVLAPDAHVDFDMHSRVNFR